MDWSEYLQPGERLLWSGRPAPRAFTFRNWRSSIFGFLLLFLSIYWQLVGVQLRLVFGTPLLDYLPLPFMAVGLYYAVGQVFLARLEWERVFYALTDQRVLAIHGLLRWRIDYLPSAELNAVGSQPLGAQLATVQISACTPPRRLTLYCLEHPDLLTRQLEERLVERGLECPLPPGPSGRR
jgi:hypothetical protein